MVNVRPIRSEEDYEEALARIGELLDGLSAAEEQIEDPDHPSMIELEVLSDLVEVYESKTVDMGFPSAIEAIEFRMDQAGLTRRDLAPFIGSSAKVSEVLSGKRPITMSMARALHHHLGIPADVLLQEPGASLPDAIPDIEWTRFPLKAMAKAGWIPDVPNLRDRAEEFISRLMEQAGGRAFAAAPLYRKNDSRRINAKTDDYALRAWCWKVLAQAQEKQTDAKYQTGAATPQLLRQIAELSVLENGPVQARELLARHGVGLEFVPHLPKTHLDGAALRLPDGRPVIGLTIRYDRIDNFWYTLVHELAHIGLHFDDCDGETGFVDDHSLRGVESSGSDKTEQEADQWAQNALIPPEIWDEGVIMEARGPMAVVQMASQARVHPAIVAGRIRYESGNYRLLSQFVGTGEVRRQFEAMGVQRVERSEEAND